MLYYKYILSHWNCLSLASSQLYQGQPHFLRSLTLICYHNYEPTLQSLLILDYGNIEIVKSIPRQCNKKVYPGEKR